MNTYGGKEYKKWLVLMLYTRRFFEKAYTFNARNRFTPARLTQALSASKLSKYMVSQIYELDMDARKRSYNLKESYKEEFPYIEVKINEVGLHYFATTVNTELGTSLNKQCVGFGTMRA